MPAGDGLRRLRVVGFAASTVMAASAYGAGALPAGDADAAVLPGGTPTAPASYWWGLAGWVVGLVGLTGVWWRLGVRLRPHPGTVPLGWLLRTGVLWAVPLLLAPPTGSRDGYAYACQGALWLDGVDPYAVGVLPGGCVWADAVPALWRDTPTPYGPLAVVFSGAAVALARLVTASTDTQLLVVIALLRVGALLGVTVVAGCLPRLARACGIDPVRATWLGLLSPLMMIHAVSGLHNDALLLGLVLAGLVLAAAARSRVARTAGGLSLPPVAGGLLRDTATGAVLGLAVAVKVTAIVALPFAILLRAVDSSATQHHHTTARRSAAHRHGTTARPSAAHRHGTTAHRAAAQHHGTTARRTAAPQHCTTARRRVLPSGFAVGVGGAVVFAGLTAAAGLDLGWVNALSDTGRLVQWTSLPTGLGMAAGYVLRLAGRPEAFDLAVTVARLLGLTALAMTIGLLLVHGWRATLTPRREAVLPPPQPARRRLVLATGLALSALALLSPIFYPWYGLTAVTVLAAGLADRRWTYRVAGLVVPLGFLVLPDGLGLAVLTKLPGAVLDVAIVALLAIVAVRRSRARGTAAARRRGRQGPPVG